MFPVAYRRVLATPGAPSLYSLALVARIPVAAAPAALTLRVVLGLHEGFARSGLVAAAVGLGMAAGAPLLGRLIDRRGARRALALTIVAQALFWVGAATLPYAWLVPAAFAGGVLSIPVFSLVRQAVAALLPDAGNRRAGMSLDSMGVEISYAIGPALGVVAVTRLGTSVAMLVLGAALVAAGVGLFVLDPPTTPELDEPEREPPAAPARPGRGLGGLLGLGPAAMAALAATMGATIALAGTDISLTASMRSFGHIGLLGVVFAMWCLASLTGGFVYGTRPKGRDPLLLLALLAGSSVLLALAGSWWALMLLTIPTGVFCAPLLASTANVITGTVDPASRGRALGIHTSALTIGNSIGAPLAGWAVDRWSPPAGYVTIGVVGTVFALVALAVGRRRGHNATHEAPLAAPVRT